MRLKLIINIATLLAVALVIVFGWKDIGAAFHTMLRLNLWVLLLMIPVQFFSFFAIAKLYYHFFRVTGVNLSMKTLLPAAVELNFVNHIFPSGGVSGFSYLTFRLKSENVSAAKSTLAQLVRFVATFVTFVGLLIVALLLLALEDKASRFIIFVATALTFSILFSTIGLVYIVGSESRIKSFTRTLARFLNKLIHLVRRSKREAIKLYRVERTFYELHKDYLLVRKDFGKMRSVIVWAVIGNLAEVGLIYVVFLAHDTWVNPGAVIIAYAVATLVGLFAILPGGVGVYEPIMAASLLSAGIPNAIALSVTLVSRVVTLLLALGSGYVLYHLALRRHARYRT
jgi:uncharacterized protein (TIRG00374 family)